MKDRAHCDAHFKQRVIKKIQNHNRMNGSLDNSAFVLSLPLHPLGKPGQNFHDKGTSVLLQSVCFLTPNFCRNGLVICMLQLREHVCSFSQTQAGNIGSKYYVLPDTW